MYGGRGSLHIKCLQSLADGSSANVFGFTMENHWGTHVDCPAHFFKDGLAIADYPAETWFFEKPFVLSLSLEENGLLYSKDIEAVPAGTDLLLIKTGFSRFRGTEKYSTCNPGISPETGIWLREKLASVRAIGFDFISISPYKNRAIGKAAHNAFLDPQGAGEPILIIEDMDLACDLAGLASVWVLPLRIAGIDSAPCTVIGATQG